MLEEKLIREDIDTFLKKQEQKELCRFVTIGSVDDGKSTLIGRLLHDSVGIFEDVLQDVGSGGEIDLARVTDGLQAEREQGITIDVAYRYFSTPARKFILADTPGHVQYTRNMATGSSTADVAIILIDARLGVLEQSRRHAYITSLLGTQHLAVCVNKMDLVDFDQAVFDRITEDFSQVTEKLGFAGAKLFPISALLGDNVVTESENTPWYSGGTLLSHLETVPIGDARRSSAFRMPVQMAIRPDLTYRGFAGQIASGALRPGDEVMVVPSLQRSKVTSIDVFGTELEEAGPPSSVSIRLEDEIDISRGDILADPNALPTVGHHIEATLIWMSEDRLDPERSYVLKHTTRSVRARVTEILHGVDLETLAEQSVSTVGLNDIVRVQLETNRELIFDAYEENRTTGAFVLIDSVTNGTVAAGMIHGGVAGATRSEARGEVSAAERKERLGHAGVHAQIVASDLETASAYAYALERRLFDLGLFPAVSADAFALSAAGLIGIEPTTQGTVDLTFEVPAEADRDALIHVWAQELKKRS